ncbi:MAG TPA: hypothetical protein VF881_12345 [Polyangiaceae bacterium]
MRQLDLFSDDAVRAARAREALERFDLRAAQIELERVAAIYPSDRAVRERLARVTRLSTIYEELVGLQGDPLVALLALGADVDGADRSAWHARVAREAEMQFGLGCMLDGEPVGLHWLLASKIDEAERSLLARLEHDPTDARARGYLADARWYKGEADRARREYLRAFIDDPGAVDTRRIADSTVADFLVRAESEYETRGDPCSWVAAVGTVERVFPMPAPTLPGFPGREESSRAPGLQFYRLISEERAVRSHNERVAVRRRMKSLCPLLFDAYLRAIY